MAARSSLSINLLSDEHQHCKKKQTKDVIVLNAAATTRKIVTPSSKSNTASRVMVATMIETALMVTVSAEDTSVNDMDILPMKSERLTQWVSRKESSLLPHTDLHLAVQDPTVLAPEEVKVHDRSILTQFETAANLPASDDAACFVFVETALGNEKTCKEVSNRSRIRIELGNRIRWLGKDEAESTRHGHLGALRWRWLLGARRKWEVFFVSPLMVVDHRLWRLEGHGQLIGLWWN